MNSGSSIPVLSRRGAQLAILVCALCTAAAPGIVLAQCDTRVLYDPTISSTTTWSTSGSPYIISGTLTIDAGATLNVDAGVVLKFYGGSSLAVNGTLALAGSSGSPIIFSSLNDDTACGITSGSTGNPAAGDWEGISVSSTGTIDADWSSIRYAGTAVTLTTPAGATLDDCDISDSYYGLAIGGAATTITGNRLTVSDGVITIGDAARPAFTDLNILRGNVAIRGNSAPSFTGGTWDGGGNIGEAVYLAYNSPDPGDTPNPVFSGVTMQNYTDVNGVYVYDDTGIAGNATLTGADFYLGSETLVTAGASLTIENANLYVLSFGASTSELQADGELILGTAGKPVVMGSDPGFSSWIYGIKYNSGATGSVTAATIHQGNLAITTAEPLVITDLNLDYGRLETSGTAAPTVSNLNISSGGVDIRGNSAPSFTGGTWDGGGDTGEAVYLAYNSPDPGDTPNPVFSGVTMQNYTDVNGVYVYDGTGIAGTATLTGADFYLGSETLVKTGASLTVENANLFIPRTGSYDPELQVDGELILGTGGSSVTVGADLGFTDWFYGIRYNPGSSGSLTSTTIKKGSLYINTAGSFAATDVTLEDGYFAAEGDAAPLVTNLDMIRGRIDITGNSAPSFVGGVWDGGNESYDAGIVIYDYPNPGDTPNPIFSGVTIENHISYNGLLLEARTGIKGTATLAGSDFFFDRLVVSASGSLTIEDANLWVLDPGTDPEVEVDGELIIGTPGKPVTIASGPGYSDWFNGIQYNSGATGSITSTTIRGGSLLITTSEPLLVSDMTIEDGYLETEGDSAPTFTSVDIVRGRIEIWGNSAPSFVGGVWDGGDESYDAGIVLYNYPNPGNTPNPVFSGVTIQNHVYFNGLLLEALTGIEGTATLAGSDFFFDQLTVSASGSLTVEDANLWVIDPGTDPELEADGELILGTTGKAVRFAPDPASPGPLYGIRYNPGAAGSVTGLSSQAPLFIGTGGAVTITSSSITNTSVGITVTGTAAPLIQGCDLSAVETSVLVQDQAAPDLGSGSGSSGGNLLSGSMYGLVNQGSTAISAQGNWWGCHATAEMEAGAPNVSAIIDHADGPYGTVDYGSWLTGVGPCTLSCATVTADVDPVCEGTEQSFTVHYRFDDGSESVVWDLDQDSFFDDATGNPATSSLPVGRPLVAARVSDTSGSCTAGAEVTVQPFGAPLFAGAEAVTTLGSGPLGLQLSWSMASESCGIKASALLVPVYNVYRSTSPGFTPGPSTLQASCVTSDFFNDTAVVGGSSYYYVVRAESPGSGGSGPCNGGTEDVNLVYKWGTAPAGAGSSPQDVGYFTATAKDGIIILEWLNPPAPYGTTRICWHQGSWPTGPNDTGAVCFDQTGDPQSVDSSLQTGLSNNAWYRYGAWVNSIADGSGEWSAGEFVSARPFATSGPVKWSYSTGATTISPPGVHPGVANFSASNDRIMHATTAGSSGGEWPASWTPTSMNAPVQDRPIVIPFGIPTVNGARTVVFSGSQDGSVYAIDATSGNQLWDSPTLGGAVQASPSGIFTAYGGSYDLILVGSRNATGDSLMYGLDLADGSVAWSFDNGGGSTGIGIISSQAWVSSSQLRVYFTSRAKPGGSAETVWCLSFTDSGASKLWSRALGDVDAAPTLRNGVLYVGTNDGEVYALDSDTGGDVWSSPYTTSDGMIRGYVWYDDSGGTERLFFSTATKVHGVLDAGSSASQLWPPVNLSSPSPVIVVGNDLYVGSSVNNGSLLRLNKLTGSQLGAVVLGDPTISTIVGNPAYDGTLDQVVVGTEIGAVYTVEAGF